MRISTIPFRTLIIASITTVLCLLSVSFIVFQARYLILGPQLTITEAPEGPQNERQVIIAGTARNISHLYLNDRQIYTDQYGTFSETVTLENGYTIVTIRAEDRFGRTTTLERPLVYAPASFIE